MLYLITIIQNQIVLDQYAYGIVVAHHCITQLVVFKYGMVDAGVTCDRNANFGYNEADVVCHQLGWSGSSSYSTGQYDRLAV